MAAPAAIAGVGMGASVLGGIVGAFGAERSGAAQNQMYQYQAGVADLNSRIALQNADYARETGEREASRYGIGAGERQGQIAASQASSGLDVGSGSAVAVRRSQHEVSMIDQTQLRENAAKTAYGYDVQSKQFEEQSQLYQMAGANAKAAGDINAMTSILSGATSVSNEWLTTRQYF